MRCQMYTHLGWSTNVMDIKKELKLQKQKRWEIQNISNKKFYFKVLKLSETTFLRFDDQIR